jgi:hypothetical protein
LDEREWAVARDDGTGWHAVGYFEVKVTRSGNVDARRGTFWQRANVFGKDDALLVARLMAEAKGDRVRDQADEDLRWNGLHEWEPAA